MKTTPASIGLPFRVVAEDPGTFARRRKALVIYHPDGLPKTLETWSYLTPDDWRQAILAAAEPVWLAHENREQLSDRLAALLDLIPDRKLGTELDKASQDMARLALHIGALMGYSLAKTWPKEIEGLDDWIGQAAELAGLDAPQSKGLRLAS
jgi:hypothetical protein